jgi:hypothetical protein
LIWINYATTAAAQARFRSATRGADRAHTVAASTPEKRRVAAMTKASNSNVSRRAVLIAAASAPVLALGAAQAASLPPSAVAYQDTPKNGKDCKGCKLFVAPSSCKSVSGTISPNGWCKLWVKT